MGKQNKDDSAGFVDIIKLAKENPTVVLTDSDFSDSFDADLILEETRKMNDSEGLYWWVNSGAYFIQENGVGKTLQGELRQDSEWQIKYKDHNVNETDDGFHPQNIFRLVTRSKWLDYTQEVEYKINKYHLSKDEHRSASNGLLLFNRYQDGDNLYYTGIRVDGAAVIKKKYKGEYYTMDYKTIIVDSKYDRETNPNLLPIEEWVSVRSEVKNINDKRVEIKLYVKLPNDVDWNLVLEAIDDGQAFGGAAITSEGFAGVRTDFMDVEFDNFKIIKLEE
ncbi:hypothetical protein KAR28_02660 [Candidatus Parcubacteria bacterium]|nr:hypothetical protein [Candidatus Parcubacteria bacterium]